MAMLREALYFFVIRLRSFRAAALSRFAVALLPRPRPHGRLRATDSRASLTFEHLIQMPAPLRMAAHVRDASPMNLGGEHRAKSDPPEFHGLVADVDPGLRQEIFDVSK